MPAHSTLHSVTRSGTPHNPVGIFSSSRSDSISPPAMNQAHTASPALGRSLFTSLIPCHPSAANQRPNTHLCTSITSRSTSKPMTASLCLTGNSRQTLRGLHPHLTNKIHCPVLTRGASITTSAQASSQPLPTPIQSSSAVSRVPEEGETAILWAGFTSLTDKIRQLEEANEQLQKSIQTLSKQHDASLQQLQLQLQLLQRHSGSSSDAAYSAMFLMSFLTFINFIGMLAAFQTHLFVPVAAKGTFYYVFVKSIVPSLVPLCNSAIVLLVCLQAVRVAWRALRW